MAYEAVGINKVENAYFSILWKYQSGRNKTKEKCRQNHKPPPILSLLVPKVLLFLPRVISHLPSRAAVRANAVTEAFMQMRHAASVREAAARAVIFAVFLSASDLQNMDSFTENNTYL